MFMFSEHSKQKLLGVHPALIKVATRCLQITTVDFGISEGVRTLQEQKDLFDQGRSKPGKIVTWTMDSKHLIQHDGYGHAFDVVAYLNGHVSWEEKLYDEIAVYMKKAAKELSVDIVCGVDWKVKDRPHYQLSRNYI